MSCNFVHTVNKGKVKVIEGRGMITLTYIVVPHKISCQCTGKHIKPLCKHLEYYFRHIGIDPRYFVVLAIPRVRSWWGQHGSRKTFSTEALNSYCHDFLTGQPLPDGHEEHCCICHDDFGVNTDRFYRCEKCQEPYHQCCFAKWTGGGNGTKGCPRCKHVRDLNGGIDDANWPDLKADS